MAANEGPLLVWDILCYIQRNSCDFETRLSMSRTCRRLREAFMSHLKEEHELFVSTGDNYELFHLVLDNIQGPFGFVDYALLTRVVSFAQECRLMYNYYVVFSTDDDMQVFTYFSEIFPSFCYFEKIDSLEKLGKIGQCTLHEQHGGNLVVDDVHRVMLHTNLPFGTIMVKMLQNGGDIVNTILALEDSHK